MPLLSMIGINTARSSLDCRQPLRVFSTTVEFVKKTLSLSTGLEVRRKKTEIWELLQSLVTPPPW